MRGERRKGRQDEHSHAMRAQNQSSKRGKKERKGERQRMDSKVSADRHAVDAPPSPLLELKMCAVPGQFDDPKSV